jgi:hypothetical protein
MCQRRKDSKLERNGDKAHIIFIRPKYKETTNNKQQTKTTKQKPKQKQQKNKQKNKIVPLGSVWGLREDMWIFGQEEFSVVSLIYILFSIRER